MRVFSPFVSMAWLAAGCGPSTLTVGEGAMDPTPEPQSSAGLGDGDGGTGDTAMAADPVETCVQGQVVIDEGQAVPSTLTGARVIVSLQDRLPGVLPVEIGRFELVATAQTGLPIAFEVCAMAQDATADYGLWGHLDLDLDHDISLGDYISVIDVPVINGGPTVGVDLPMAAVKSSERAWSHPSDPPGNGSDAEVEPAPR
ncbi:MAG: hypothetical protein B7733_04370 [Myxococcales bacterium FL481]|nr:MAG: hypothetical protein B7733_04370 [Myxococcales bacterium FL481]